MNDFYSNKYYSPKDLSSILKSLPRYNSSRKSNNQPEYIEIPCAFDIETSSFYEKNEKRAIMYEWTFGIDGYIIIGRKWSEFINLIDELKKFFRTRNNRRLLIGVHNLAFEFQFMRKRFKWDKVFSIDKRKPIYAITDGIEFRCTYMLTNLSLAKVAEDCLFKYKIAKDVGDLDYDKIRNYKTPLSEEEIKYCIDDVKIVMALMEEKAEQDGGYCRIPLTKTAYVRNRCRNRCFGINDEFKDEKKYGRYTRAIKLLTLTADDYNDLKAAFRGGFTHANSWWSTEKMHIVSSYDFTSSYPAVLLTEKYPMSKPLIWNSDMINTLYDEFHLNGMIEKYCLLMQVKFTNIREKFIYEHYLSKSKSFIEGKYKIDNGRIIRADYLTTTITEQDYLIIRDLYEWDKIEFIKVKSFFKDYLPEDFIKTILELYKKKTELKGIEGMEIEYMSSKSDLNSLYGMCVMDIVRDENAYDDDWVEEPEDKDIEKIIDAYNKNKGRFLYYPWGVWCTAYARRNLFTGILEFGEDYIYSDTDSIKVQNAKNHLEYFSKYADNMKGKIQKISDYYNIPIENFSPKTKKGKEKMIGVWDYEGTYRYFKTLGAKRYMVQYLNTETWEDEISLTVSGIDKKEAIPYLKDKYKNFDDIFDAFKEGLVIPAEHTGKRTHTYLDDEYSGEVIDYLGNKASYNEKSSIHLEGSEYNLSISDDYVSIILEILKRRIRE